MERENIRPSPLQNKNLAILVFSRMGYFTYKGLHPYLLSTYFFYIEEKARVPLTQILLPIIADDNNRRILEKAVKNQPDYWEPLKPFESSWTFFRKTGIGSIKNQPFEDLMQLEYHNLLDGVVIPDNADLSLFWGGLVDFLINSWSVLEEFCIVIEIKDKVQEEKEKRERESVQEEGLPPAEPGKSWRKLVTWSDMQLEHHFMNIVLRLRAGWDKLSPMKE